MASANRNDLDTPVQGGVSRTNGGTSINKKLDLLDQKLDGL